MGKCDGLGETDIASEAAQLPAKFTSSPSKTAFKEEEAHGVALNDDERESALRRAMHTSGCWGVVWALPLGGYDEVTASVHQCRHRLDDLIVKEEEEATTAPHLRIQTREPAAEVEDVQQHQAQ